MKRTLCHVEAKIHFLLAYLNATFPPTFCCSTRANSASCLLLCSVGGYFLLYPHVLLRELAVVGAFFLRLVGFLASAGVYLSFHLMGKGL